MALVNKINKQIQMNLWDVVQFQIVSYCQINKIQLSLLELNCLTYLAIKGESELTSFCKDVADKNIFGSPQSARNALRKADLLNLIVKNGKSKKTIKIHPNMNIQTKGNILIDYRLVRIEPKETEQTL